MLFASKHSAADLYMVDDTEYVLLDEFPNFPGLGCLWGKIMPCSTSQNMVPEDGAISALGHTY